MVGSVLKISHLNIRRSKRLSLNFLKRTMRRYGRPRSIATDRLRSYRSAMKVIGNAAEQECGRCLNNRAENFHQPFRRREGAMAKFRDVNTYSLLGCYSACTTAFILGKNRFLGLGANLVDIRSHSVDNSIGLKS